MTARTRKIVVILGAGGLVAAGCGGTAASSGTGGSSAPRPTRPRADAKTR